MLDPSNENYLFLMKEITLSPYHMLIDYDELKRNYPDYILFHEALIHNLTVSDKYDSILILGLVLRLHTNIQEGI